METELETVFTSIYKDVCLLKLNESFIDINKYIANDSEFSMRLSQLKYMLQNFICCMDKYITENRESPNSFNSEVPLLKICVFKKSIYPEYLQLLELDDLIKLEKLFDSIREMNYDYKVLFIYTLNPTPYINQNSQLTELDRYERLLTKIFEYVKHRNFSIDIKSTSIFDNYDNFDYDNKLICDFIKYSFHNINEFENYSKFLSVGLFLFNEKIPANLFPQKQLDYLLEYEGLKLSNPKRIKYFVQSDKELLLNQIKSEVYNHLILLGLKSKPEIFFLIFDYEADHNENSLKFDNPKKVPISFIMKLLMENNLISEEQVFKCKSTKGRKSPKGYINYPFNIFSKSFNNTYKPDNYNNKNLKPNDFIWLDGNNIDLTLLVELIQNFNNLQ